MDNAALNKYGSALRGGTFRSSGCAEWPLFAMLAGGGDPAVLNDSA